MFIIAREGETYCRLRFRAGPGGAFEIPVRVDFESKFVGSNFEAWAGEYDSAVRAEFAVARLPRLGANVGLTAAADADDLFDPFFETFDLEREHDFHERPL